MNLAALADETLKTFGEYPFLIFDDRTYTNKQIIQQATWLAGSLRKLGVKKGDNVVVRLTAFPKHHLPSAPTITTARPNQALSVNPFPKWRCG